MKPVAIASTYDWAMEYLNYCVKEGALDESEIEGKTEKELIDMANKMEDAAQWAYDSLKDEGKI